jgi:ABC-type uncharacterized transport system involved in gliding motility auxiliary subunit
MKRLVGVLGWVGVLLVVGAVVLRFAGTEWAEVSRRLALAGLVVTGLYALSQWRDIGRSIGGRGVRYGSIAATSVLLVLAILAGLNWIASRQNKRWDLTAAGQFSLSDQTRQILEGLDEPLRIRVFYAGSAEQYRDRLTEYTYHAPRLTVEYIDAQRDPLQAQSAGIDSVPTIILEHAGRAERATAVDEQTLTNALKKVVEGAPKKVYFVQGHGEADPTSSEPGGYSGMADALRTDNFEVANLTLAQAGAVPNDATVVAIAGPQTDLLDPEVTALRAFLDRGGKVHLLLDPPEAAGAAPLTNLLNLAREWGMEVGHNLVIDASGLGQILGTDASVPVAMPVEHAITRNFAVMTAFPLARSVTPVDGGVDGRTAQTIVETGPQSWAETDIIGVFETGRPERNLDTGDVGGPVPIAAAVSIPAPNPPAPSTLDAAAEGAEAGEDGDTPDTVDADAPPPESRMVVVGDSDFASNRALGLQGNRELFLNMANWLAQQEDLIAIRPRSPEDRPITMTADQGRWVFWFTMLIVPALLFSNAVRVYWRKR